MFITLKYVQDIDHNTDHHTFKKKWGHDPRFEALDRKERETLLNERYCLDSVWSFGSYLHLVLSRLRCQGELRFSLAHLSSKHEG